MLLKCLSKNLELCIFVCFCARFAIPLQIQTIAVKGAHEKKKKKTLLRVT